jgi:hypothetical protein
LIIAAPKERKPPMNNPWLKNTPTLSVRRNGADDGAPSPTATGAERRPCDDAAVALLMNDLVGLWLQTLTLPQRQRSSRRSMRH